ncbi:uncharacterized protein LOC126474949 [Schistocerca serialis cubense]|uniref:uncharacterized protein LOC126474949 n=1 Tax=Schistocerca serialis cubense TaxID=2023355 RepID=UPI00214E1E50|nr:uncharacterized protein LOC126474949 [Schistocerca serialis cubense]
MQKILPGERTSSLKERKQGILEETWTKYNMETEYTHNKQVSQIVPYSQKAKVSDQRCNEKRKVSQETKQCGEAKDTAVREKSCKLTKLLGTTVSSDEQIHSENGQNKSELQEAVVAKSKMLLQRQIDIRKLRMTQKVLPFTHFAKKNTEIPLPEKVVVIELEAGSLANALTEAELQALKKFVSALKVKIMGAWVKKAKTV